MAKPTLGGRRKAVDLGNVPLVKTRSLENGSALPLVLEPARENVDLAEWAGANREYVEAELLKHGAILFQGFGLGSIEAFEQVALAIYGDLFGEYGDLPRESASGKIYTSTPYPPDKAILFHNESAHLHRWPMKISFFSVQAAAHGGATPILDCRRVCRELDADVLNEFQEKGLLYVRNFLPGVDVSWQKFFQTNDRAAVEAACRQAQMEWEWLGQDRLRLRTHTRAVLNHPKTGDRVFFNQVQLHHPYCLDPEVRSSLLSLLSEEELPRNVYYGDGTRIPDAVMAQIGEVYDRLAVRFPWHAGDMVMLDNMLTSHARDPFEGPRKNVVAMGQMIDSSAVNGKV